MPDTTRIAIIGAGTGGYVAAIRAAQLGAQVTLVESTAVGGLCLNWGCIPSKSLLACAELGQKIKKASEFGITITGTVSYDLARMVERKNKIVAGLVKGVRTLLKTWNVELVEGRGVLGDPKTVRVVKPDGTDTTVRADAVILGTGTTSPSLPNLPIDGTHVITSREALDLMTIPENLLIVGGGGGGLGLAQAGVSLGRRGEILVNERMETTAPGVYAIGDVVGKALLAHVASAQGKVAVRNILGHPTTMRYDVIPAGIFTFPEIGRVGLTEQEAKEQGLEIKVGKFRPIGLGKAHVSGETTGLMKIITDAKTGRIVGVHLVGAHAADLIHEAAVALQMGATAETLAQTVHAHPTMPEGLMEAAEDVEGLAIHLARRKVGKVVERG